MATPYVSPQIERILGFTAQEWTDDPALWIRRVHDEDRDRVLAASDLADRTGEPLTIEYRHIRKDGALIWDTRRRSRSNATARAVHRCRRE
jgi:PAS domain S-box-containing protein